VTASDIRNRNRDHLSCGSYLYWLAAERGIQLCACARATDPTPEAPWILIPVSNAGGTSDEHALRGGAGGRQGCRDLHLPLPVQTPRISRPRAEHGRLSQEGR